MRPTATPVFWYAVIVLVAGLAGAFGPDPFAPLVASIHAHGGLVGWLTYHGFLS